MTDHAERRLAPRYEVIAQANVGAGDEATLMSVRNISTTGVFLEGNPAEHPELKLGALIELTLSASDPSQANDEVIEVRCKGRIARIEPARPPHAGGFGLTLTPANREDDDRLRALVGHLSHVPPPRPRG
jgi:hypothetical protein